MKTRKEPTPEEAAIYVECQNIRIARRHVRSLFISDYRARHGSSWGVLLTPGAKAKLKRIDRDLALVMRSVRRKR